jgi:glycine cleavage system H protein
VKSASDIKTPISGTIVEVNSALEEKPAVMGTKPEESGEGGGWIAKIEIDAKEVEEWEGLMREEEYKALLDE